MSLPDHLKPGLRVVFVGINPGLASDALGHHYAGRGNRFWPAMEAAGLVPAPWPASRDAGVLELGYGLTNLASRPTSGASELGRDDVERGRAVLLAAITANAPEWAAFVGATALRGAFGVRGPLALGPQPQRIGTTRTWLLPSPSGRNTRFTTAAVTTAFAAFAAQLALPRFAVLAHHTVPFHYDLLLEHPREATCWTWRLDRPPGAVDGLATRIADHRPWYLVHEGEVSGGRGRVERIDRGWYELLGGETAGPIRVRLHGHAASVDLTLPRA